MKIPYKPPKVQPSKNKKSKPLPEWNGTINDLDKYKLSSSEVLKKKIKSVSKNLGIAKKDWNEQIQKSSTSQKENKPKEKESSYSTMKQNLINFNYNTTSTPDIKRERSLSSKNFKNKSKTKSVTLLNIQKQKDPTHSKNKSLSNFNIIKNESEENESQIQMINNPFSIKVSSTKVEKLSEKDNKFYTLNNLSKNKLLLDDDLNEKLRQLEDNLLGIEKHKDSQLKQSYYPSEMNESASESPNSLKLVKHQIQQNKTKQQPQFEDHYDLEKNEDNENIYGNLNDDLIKKFDNLTDLEDSMKKLNQILDFSSKSSMKFKVDYDEINTNKYSAYNKDLDLCEPEPYVNKLQNFNNMNTNVNKNDTIIAMKNGTSNYINTNFDNNSNKNINKIMNSNPKTIEISKNRRVIDFDDNNNKFSGNKSDIYEEKDEQLDYLKDLLLKTKSDLDNLNKNLETNSGNNQNSVSYSNQKRFHKAEFSYDNKFIDEDELEPRAPPTILSSYKKII